MVCVTVKERLEVGERVGREGVFVVGGVRVPLPDTEEVEEVEVEKLPVAVGQVVPLRL